MAELTWRAKMESPKFKIVLLHENSDERKPHEETAEKGDPE
jgi:hypothetical protein